MATSFFLMELEHGKYFVGASKDPLKTLEEHREGVAGMAWTQIHHPVRLKEIVAVARPRELDDYVRRCMLEWVWNMFAGVHGAMYAYGTRTDGK